MKNLQFQNGDTIPMLGLGTWKSEPGDVYEAVKEAVHIGYRHLDCAPIYGNEPEIGQALSECFQEGLVTRDEMFITSKLWNDSHAPGDVKPALEGTLADLRLNYLDLFLIHWPVAFKKGVAFPETADEMIGLDELPIAETWEALEAAVDEGLCRHIGVSNFSAAKVRTLLESARLKPEMNQIELHPYLQQAELVDFCRANGVHVTAYSPLGSRDRSPEFKAPSEPDLFRDPTVRSIAERHGITPAQVLIAWAVQRGTSVIPKSTNPERMEQNLAAAEISLSAEDMRTIASLDRHSRYIVGDFFALPGSAYTVASLWDE